MMLSPPFYVPSTEESELQKQDANKGNILSKNFARQLVTLTENEQYRATFFPVHIQTAKPKNDKRATK